MDVYTGFLIKHAPIVGSIESLVESVAYILPGRFAHSELVAEALHSLVSILSTFHDSVLSSHFGASFGGQSKFNCYTRHMLAAKGHVYRLSAYIATLAEYVQVFLEMLARDYVGDAFRWKIIAKIEAIKFACRLIMFHKTKCRMILGSHVLERDYDMEKIQKQQYSNIFNGAPVPTPIGTHSGRQLPNLRSIESKNSISDITEGDVVTFVNKKAVTAIDVALPHELVSKQEGLSKVAEVLFMLRPLTYLLALRKFGSKSWIPWLVSLVIDSSSLGIHLGVFAPLQPMSNKPISAKKLLEKDEIRRRLWLLVYYLVRDPFYSWVVKNRLRKFVDSLSKKPVVSLFAGLLGDYLPLWENYYYLVNP